jgi:hypothetical protein
MSRGRETGGPAFPVNDVYRGMTLRDWFAGMAVQGLFAALPVTNALDMTYEDVAGKAYRMADAMLKERTDE